MPCVVCHRRVFASVRQKRRMSLHTQPDIEGRDKI